MSFPLRPVVNNPITTPLDIQDLISFITPASEQNVNPFVTPLEQFGIQGNISTPNLGPVEPQSISFMGNPDFTGQRGFPEKPTGLGGLRPLGGFNPIKDPLALLLDQHDPGGVSLTKQFGKKSMQDMAAQLLDLSLNIRKENKLSNKISNKQNNVQLNIDKLKENIELEFGNLLNKPGVKDKIFKDITDLVKMHDDPIFSVDAEDAMEAANNGDMDEVLGFIDEHYPGGLNQWEIDNNNLFQ